MDKIGILTEKLETVGVKYFGLDMPMRQAILSAMEDNAKNMNKPLARVLITENCRKIDGVEGSFDEACRRLKENYLLFTSNPNNKKTTWAIELKQSKK